MQWIKFFKNYNIPYYVYKLNKEDYILIYNHYPNTNKSIIILHGSIYVIKIFTNKETMPLAILNKNNIFTLEEKNINYKFYYKLVALEQTYIVSFQLTHFTKIKKNYYLLLKIIKSYNNTLTKYEIMNEILNQKYAKNKIIHLILFLCLEYGIIHKKQIYIPFRVSQRNLAVMTGTNKATINKVMKYICKNIPIKYSSKKNLYIKNIFRVN